MVAIKHLHEATNQVFPESDYVIDGVLQGLKRQQQHTPRRALPITLELLKRIRPLLNLEMGCDLAFWSAMLTAFHGLFRKASMCPRSLAKYDPVKDFSRAKVDFPENSNMALLLVTWSKTIQFAERTLFVPLLENARDPDLCPVSHLRTLHRRYQLPASSHAFAYLDEFGREKLVTYSEFSRRLKNLLGLIGVDSSRYSGHSFRRGGSSLLHKLSAPDRLIQAAGDWASETFKNYLHISLKDRL